MEWEIELHDEVEQWFVNLCREDPVSADRAEEAIDMLAREALASGGRWSIGSRARACTT
jgi:hypothetical protein